MKISINRERCIGCRSCAEICPEVFKMNAQEKSEVYGEVTESVVDAVEDAMAICPVFAIERE